MTTGGGYWLQVEALSSEAKAYELAAYYQDLDGLEVMVIPEGGLYKVRIGRFADRAAAREVRKQYQEDWFIIEG